MATKDTTNEAAEPNTLKDRWGQEHEWDPQRYPEDSAAREGHITKPSGQGGATPKARPDHQDMFPKNPEPSDEVKAAAEENDRIERGEVSRVNPRGDSKGPKAAPAPKKDEK